MNLLVALDLSESSATVVEQAKALTTASAGKIWLLHVADPDPDFIGYEVGPQYIRDAAAQRFHKEHHQIQAWSEQLRASGLDCVARLVQGPTVDTILHEAKRLGANVIVVGSHGKGAVRRLLVGSTSEALLRHSTIPVLIVPTHGRPPAEQ